MTSTTFDAVQYKTRLRAEWRDAPLGWRVWFDVLDAENAGFAVSRRLIQLAGIGPGDAVLDVAAGYGEPGLTAARAVAPNGLVVCTDISGEMLSYGAERAAAEGLDNVKFIECDAEELVFDEGSFDAVLSRQGLQFLPDVGGVLARLYAFLKPHGRLAAAVWGQPTTVQFAAPVPSSEPSSSCCRRRLTAFQARSRSAPPPSSVSSSRPPASPAWKPAP
jgi:SAM-dependent methyltransferase